MARVLPEIRVGGQPKQVAAFARLPVLVRISQAMMVATTVVFLYQGETPWGIFDEQPSARSLRDIEPTMVSAEVRGLDVVGADTKLYNFRGAGGTNTHEKNKSVMETLIEMVAGFICLAMALCLLWLNEGHAVRMDQLFALAYRRVKDVASAPADPENVHELVATTGNTTTNDELVLSSWNSLKAPPNSGKLRYTGYMYQWEEKESDNNGSKSYSYTQKWVDHHISSASFHTNGYENPPAPRDFLQTELATVSLGDYTLPKRMMGRLQNWQAVPEVKTKVTEFSLGGYSSGRITTHNGKEAVYFASGNSGGSYSSPAVGDFLSVFDYVACATTSALGLQVKGGEQQGDWTFTPLQFVEHHSYAPGVARASTASTNLGDEKHETLLGENERDEYLEDPRADMSVLKNGVDAMMKGFPNPMAMADAFLTAACPDQIFSIEEGTHNGRQLLAMERSKETHLVWLIRFFAYFLAVISCNMIFSPLRFLLSYLWFIGAILNAGIHLFACLCATSLSTCTVASAWIAYRPLYALFLVVVPLGAFAYVEYHGDGSSLKAE